MRTMSKGAQPAHRSVWSGLTTADADRAHVGILGIPYDGASSFRKGSSEAPSRIRSLTPHVAPFTEDGTPLAGLRVHDAGDAPIGASWDEINDSILDAAAKVLDHPFALFLGGDHAVTIPTAAAAARAIGGSMGLFHLDAHLDLMNTFEGRAWSHACTARRVMGLPGVSPETSVFVGIRSWLGEEVDYLAQHPETGVFTARDVARRGTVAIADAVCTRLDGVDGVYVTLDIDVLDPAFAPGTGTPEAGGLTTRDLLDLLRVAFERLPIRALDLVEVSPRLDHADITSFAAIKVIYEAFGWVVARVNDH